MAPDVTVLIGPDRDRDLEDLLHDLRSPLSVIRGQCHAIMRAPRPPQELQRRLALIDGEVERIVSGIERARGILRGETSAERSAPVELAALLCDVAERHRGTASERGVSISVDAPTAGGVVVGVLDELSRMLDNLVVNAVAHAPFGTAVRIGATSRRGRIAVRIADEGPGLDSNCAQHIFQRGIRGPDSHGWGLGLGIAHDIACRHNGALTVEHPESGAAFCLELPMGAPGAPREAA